ncbi:hypothetical protein ACNOYE_29720 [Nannocystaceae bacterium ST9]
MTNDSDSADKPGPGPTVKLRYRLRGGDGWLHREVAFDELFGGAGQPGDLFEDVDWIPRHAAVDLIPDIEATDIAVTELSFEGDEGQKLKVQETFWNHGRSRVIEVMQQLAPGSEPYWEVIVDLRRESSSETYELIRLGREGGAVVPLHHAVTHAQPDGSLQDLQIFPTRG